MSFKASYTKPKLKQLIKSLLTAGRTQDILSGHAEMGKAADGSHYLIEQPLQQPAATWCNGCGSVNCAGDGYGG